MTKSLLLKNKNYLIDDDSDDENETVEWIEQIETKKYFDCGCCDECLCDDNKPCDNCGCNCNGDDLDDELYDDDDDEEDNEDDEESDDEDDNHSNKKGNLSNFNINIIENQDKEKKVRITLELNVILDNKKNEVICIDLDINSSTYLKIAEELFKA